jgi:multidrug resistance efflux pump
VGTEVKDGEAVRPEDAATDGPAAKRYRRLREGDAVEAGQLLWRLDDRLARGDVAAKEALLRVSEAEQNAAMKTKEEAERRVKAMEDSMRLVPGSISIDDYQGANLTAVRYREDGVAKKATVELRKAELEYAKAVLATYEYRSPVRGVVREIPKLPGEAVRTGEPVLRVAVPTP